MTLRRAARRPVAALAAALAVGGAALAAPAAASPTATAPAVAPAVAHRTAAASPTAAAPAAASASVAPAHATTTEPETDLDVEITDLGPPVLRPGQTLTVRGTVENPTAEDATDPVLRLRLQRYTPVSRTALQRWMEPGSYSTTVVLAREELDEVPAGASATFSVEIAPEDLGLPESFTAWGPHGVEVGVEDTSGSGLAGADRSIVLWYPDVDVEPTPVSVLVPLTPTAAERADASVAGTAVGDAAAPRLLELLDAVDHPGVTAVVDGSLLAVPAGEAGTQVGAGAAAGGVAAPGDGGQTADGQTDREQAAGGPTDRAQTADGQSDGRGTEGGPADGTEAGTTAPAEPAEPDPAPPSDSGAEPAAEATGWSGLLDRVTAMGHASGQEVAVLPWADADVAALAHTGAEARLAASTAAATDAARRAGLADAPVLTWPATMHPDLATVAAGDAAGTAAAVLPVTAATPLDDLTYTPEGRADLVVTDSADGSHTVPAVLVDDRASAVLTGQMLPRAGTGEDLATELDPLDARQLLLADTAVISRERPSDPRAVVLALPRQGVGDTTELGATLETLLAAPWVEPAPLSAAVAREAPELERGTLPESEIDPDEIGAGELARMEDTVARARSFASVTASPEQVVDPVVDALEPALSAAWREDPAGRTALLDRVAAEVTALDGQVVALESSPLNLINSSAELPVHVRNDLSTDVTVQVDLQPSDQRLQVPGPVTLTVPARSQSTAQVPVRAVGSGDVSISVDLLTPDGRPVGTSADLRVRARPDWESMGTGVVAGLLAVMLVIGLVRTVRRGRRMDPHTPVPDEVA